MALPPIVEEISGQTFDGDDLDLYYLIDPISAGNNPLSYPANLLRQSTKNIRRFNIKNDKFSGNAYNKIIRWIKKQKRDVIYISPNGNDITGSGTRTNPFLTLHKAYSVTGSTFANADIKYIIAMDGVYDLDTMLDNANIGGTLAYENSQFKDRTTLFFGNETWREKHFVVISETLHGCKIKGSVDLQLDTTYGINGISLGIKRYKIQDKHLPYAEDMLFGPFRIYDYDYNQPHNVRLTRPSTIVAAMLNKGSTGSQYPELYQSYPSAFTVTGLTLNNSTHFESYQGSGTSTLYGITGPNGKLLFNVVSERNASGVTTTWTDTTLLFYGGNNTLSSHKIVGISYAQQKINVRGKPSFTPLKSVAFIGNKSWIGNTYEYGYEITQNQKYFYIKSDSTITPRISLIDYGINLCRTKNIQFIGFDIFEFKRANIGLSSSDVNSLRQSSNIVLKYNAIHDSEYDALEITTSNSRIHGNLIYRSYHRGMQLNQSTSTDVVYNTLVGWTLLTGIYSNKSSNIKIYGNSLYTMSAAHGNGMAFYLGCRNFDVSKNFIFTPYNIGLAVQEYDGETGGIGFQITNNVIFADQGIKIYETDKNSSAYTYGRPDLTSFNISNNFTTLHLNSIEANGDPWWRMNRMAFRNNFFSGPNHVFPLYLSSVDFFGNSVLHLTPNGELSSGISGNFNIGTTYGITAGGVFRVHSVPSEYTNQINDFGINYAIYAGICGANKWTHYWLPGITLNGVMTADAYALNKWWAYNKNYDGITCVYNNVWLEKSPNASKTTSLGVKEFFDHTDPQCKSRLLTTRVSSSDRFIFDDGYFIAANAGSTLQVFLRDPTAEQTGRYDFRGKPTVQDYLTEPVRMERDNIGVNWVGPSYKGFTYTQFMTANLYDWWLYNEGT